MAYFAGYIDADGCLRFAAGTPRIEVGGLQPFVLRELAACFGGTVRLRNATPRPFWSWGVAGAQAHAAIGRLLPYLRVKAGQARLVLAACRLPPGSRRDSVVAEIRALKRVHYHE